MFTKAFWRELNFKIIQPSNILLIKEKLLIVGLILALVMGITARLSLMNESLWGDEISSTRFLLGDIYELILMLVTSEQMPVYYTFMFFWGKIFPADWFYRLPSLLAGVASIFLCHDIAKRYLSNHAALFATCLLSLSAVHVHYSVEARHYILVLTLVLLECKLVLDLIENKKPYISLKLWGLFFSIVLCSLMLPYALIISVPVLLLPFFMKDKALAMRIFFSCLAGVFVVLLYISLRTHISPLPTKLFYLREFKLSEWLNLWFNWFSTSNAFSRAHRITLSFNFFANRPLFTLMCGIYVLLFILGLKHICRNFKNQILLIHNLLIMGWVWLLPFSLWVLYALGKKNYYLERTALFNLPFFIIIIVLGASTISSKLIKRAIFVFLIFASIGSLYIYLVRDEAWVVQKRKPDFKSVYAYLQQQRKEAMGPILINSGVHKLVLNYYNGCYDTGFKRRGYLKRAKTFKHWLRSSIFHNSRLERLMDQRVQEGFDSSCTDGLSRVTMSISFLPDFYKYKYIYHIHDLNQSRRLDRKAIKYLKSNKQLHGLGSIGFKNVIIYKFLNTKYTDVVLSPDIVQQKAP